VSEKDDPAAGLGKKEQRMPVLKTAFPPPCPKDLAESCENKSSKRMLKGI
jgi:hypothetical protein